MSLDNLCGCGNSLIVLAGLCPTPHLGGRTLRSTRVKFPKNGWYAAIWSKDLTDAPVARTLLGEPLVLFRRARGRPAALEEPCCHRATPLSRGPVAGAHLRCGHHGLDFDTPGQGRAVPG